MVESIQYDQFHSDETKGMGRVHRRQFILSQLTKNKAIEIHEITRFCRVSEITARRDLNELYHEGMLVRTHGGATIQETNLNCFDFDVKLVENKKLKADIGRKAASVVQENDTIYMDCGTTVFYMATFLHRLRNLRVITNSLPVVAELMPFPNVSTYLIGGELDNSRKALYGPMTENLLNRYKADKAFIGAGGVSLANGLSSIDEKEASITRKMAEAARQVYLLCDSTKLERDSYFTYSSLSLVHYLITDAGVSKEIIDQYQKNNIQIIIS